MLLGQIGGQHYSYKGGAATYLCMPSDPEYRGYILRNDSDANEMRNYLHGAEYEKEDASVYPFSNANTDRTDDYDAPCAVCRVNTRISVIMQPAKVSCPNTWTREYQGFLMSELFSDARTEHICVDYEPEVIPASNYSFDGAGLFLVEGVCGSLACPPYVAERELTCSVCTK